MIIRVLFMSLFLSLGSLLYGQGKIVNENIMYFSDENPDTREVKILYSLRLNLFHLFLK